MSITTRVISFIGAVTQPNLYDCQATCIYKVTGGTKSIGAIRSSLEYYGNPGDPYNMGEEIKSLLKPGRYEYKGDASINDMRKYLDDGCVLITHGWFSRSGHVIVLDGRKEGLFDVADPFEEFDAASWTYPNYWGYRRAYDGFYSELLIYSTCVAGNSLNDAYEFYQQGKIEPNFGNAWLHIIKPE